MCDSKRNDVIRFVGLLIRFRLARSNGRITGCVSGRSPKLANYRRRILPPMQVRSRHRVTTGAFRLAIQ